LYYTDPFEFLYKDSNTSYLIETKDEQSKNNVIIVKQFLEYVLNKGYVELIDDLVAADYVGHFVQRKDNDVYSSDRDYLKQAILRMHQQYPDYHVHFFEHHVHNTIVTAYSESGCLKNDLPFVEDDPDDQYEERDGVFLFRVENNKIIESNYESMRWLGKLRNLKQ
jgi:hypothetical protein